MFILIVSLFFLSFKFSFKFIYHHYCITVLFMKGILRFPWQTIMKVLFSVKHTPYDRKNNEQILNDTQV